MRHVFLIDHSFLSGHPARLSRLSAPPAGLVLFRCGVNLYVSLLQLFWSFVCFCIYSIFLSRLVCGFVSFCSCSVLQNSSLAAFFYCISFMCFCFIPVFSAFGHFQHVSSFPVRLPLSATVQNTWNSCPGSTILHNITAPIFIPFSLFIFHGSLKQYITYAKLWCRLKI